MLLDPRMIRMPALADGIWLNSQPLSRADLLGRVVLVDFWDYSCVNCIRTLPYLTAWYGRYAASGLVILGIHTPEFKFAHLRNQIEEALHQYQIHYPVMLDNGFENWYRFANKAWPTKYLIDSQGYIRFQRQGEGHYQATEQAIQLLLKERDPVVQLPDLLPPLREEDTPGAVCYRPMPEIYAGYQGGGLFGGGLGNVDGYLPQVTVLYELPGAASRERHHFYLEGAWRAWPESMAFAGQDGGRVVLPYTAASVNAVLAPSADEVELALGLRPSAAAPVIEVRQDGRFLADHIAGSDIVYDEAGASLLVVDRPRMYEIVRNMDFESHELSLLFRASGLALYAFTFTGCVAPTAAAGRHDTFRVK